MDPLTIITAALAAGAAAGLKGTAELVVKDAYAGLKALVKKKWGKAVDGEVRALERDPGSKESKQALQESLKDSPALQDRELVTLAVELLKTVREHDRPALKAGGLSVGDVGKLNVNQIIQAGQINHNRAARDVVVNNYYGEGKGAAESEHERSLLQPLMVSKMDAYPDLMQDKEIALANDEGRLTVNKLRGWLLKKKVWQELLPKPMRVTVTGTLFPSALLRAGWWDSETEKAGRNIEWNTRLQAWLFHGFDVWGPSWDFTFDLKNWEQGKERPYFIAQLGHGDEADSIPLLVPRKKAEAILEHIDACGDWPGFQAEVKGTLLHRKHIEGQEQESELELFGGLLDYFIRLDDDNKADCIRPLNARTGIYSGYLWKCVIPKSAVNPGGKLFVEDAYFLWEHTNFANTDSVAYNIDSLEAKERYIEKMKGELVLVQKSNVLVPGEPKWTSQEVYNSMLARTKIKI
jgi:hypothetical protein